MSYGNKARLKHPERSEQLDLTDQFEAKSRTRNQQGNLDLQLSHLGSNFLAFDLNQNLDLGLRLLSKDASFVDVMTRPLNGNGYDNANYNSSINEYRSNDLKTAPREGHVPRSHLTDGGDDEMQHRLGGRIENRRSRSSGADLFADHVEKMSWANGGGFLQTNMREEHPEGNHIFKILPPDLVSNSEGNTVSPWLKYGTRPKFPRRLGGKLPPDLDEEPDWRTDIAPIERVSRLAGAPPNKPVKMRPSSEPPRLRFQRSEQNHLGHYQQGNEKNYQLGYVQMPEETAYNISSPPVSTIEGKQKTRKKRKLSPKGIKGQKNETKVGADAELANTMNRSKLIIEHDKTEKHSPKPPCLQGYSPPSKDKTPFKRTAKTFSEIRLANPHIDYDGMQHKQETEEIKNTLTMDNTKPCFTNLSPKSNLPFKRSSSPNPSPKIKSGSLQPSFPHERRRPLPKKSAKAGERTPSPKRNRSTTNQLTPCNRSTPKASAQNGVSATVCYPSYSPPSHSSGKSQSRLNVKSPPRSNQKGKSQTNQNSPRSRSKSPCRGKAQSPRSTNKTKRSPSPDSRTKCSKASPASSQTNGHPTYPPPCGSGHKFHPSKSASKTNIKQVSPGARLGPSWGSLADTAMPLHPSFLPTFYDDRRASPPSQRMSLMSTSDMCRDGRQHDFSKQKSPSPQLVNDLHASSSNRSMVRASAGTPTQSPSRNAKPKGGSHKNGKKGKRGKKDKNDNKRHRTKNGRKKALRSEEGRRRSTSRGDSCVPAYTPCTKSPRSEAVQSASETQLAPRKDQAAPPACRPSKSRLCNLCKKFSPKAKVNLRWPSPCRRKCGQNRPGIGMLARIGQAFGSQLRTIASNRFSFPGFTPLYISDAGLEEWFHYPTPQDMGGSRSTPRPASSRPESEKPGSSRAKTTGRSASGASGTSGALVTAEDGGTTPSRQDSQTLVIEDLEVAEGFESAEGAEGFESAEGPEDPEGLESAEGEGSVRGEGARDGEEAGGDLQLADIHSGSVKEFIESGGQDGARKKDGLQEVQKSEAQCYRMRATVRSCKDMVEVNLEECNGVMCSSRKSCKDKRKPRVGHRRSASRGSDGGSRGFRHDKRGGGGGGSGGGKGSRKASSTERSGLLQSDKSARTRSGEKSGGSSPRKSPRPTEEKEMDSELSDTERHGRNKKRREPLSKNEDDLRNIEELSTAEDKSDRKKHSTKKQTKSSSKENSYGRSPHRHEEVSSVSESSDAYSTSRELADDSSQGDVTGRKAKSKRIVVSSDSQQNIKVRCMSSDSDKDCKLVSTCRRRRGTKYGNQDAISENDMECQNFLCGDDSLVKVCTASPGRYHRERRHHLDDDLSPLDNSSNQSKSNIHTLNKHRWSPNRKRQERLDKQQSPRQHFSSSHVSSESFSLDCRTARSHRSPSDSFVWRESQHKNKSEASMAHTESSIGSPVDPTPRQLSRHGSPNKMLYGGDGASVGKLNDTPGRSTLNQSKLAPSYFHENDQYRRSLNSSKPRYDDRDNHLAEIKGRMKFLSVDGGTARADKRRTSSRMTSVGIKNGTVKMTASPKDMKIIRCDPDDAYERSMLSSVESYAFDEEELFMSRPDPNSIRRYERDSQYIKMRQQRLERLERSINASNMGSPDFTPKSQYLNKVSRRKRSLGRVMSSGDTDPVLSYCTPSETCRSENELKNKRETHGAKPQGMVRHPELLDQFSRIITPEQAIRLAEARNVVTTDSDASGLLADLYKKPVAALKDSSQNNCVKNQPAEKLTTNVQSIANDAVNMESRNHVMKDQGDAQGILKYYFTPPSFYGEDSFESQRYKWKAIDQDCNTSKVSVPFHNQTNNSSALSTIHIQSKIIEEACLFKAIQNNIMLKRPAFYDTARPQHDFADRNQSSNTDDDHHSSAVDPVPADGDVFQDRVIDTLRLSQEEDPPLPQTVTLPLDVTPAESSSSFNASPNHCSSPLRQYSHLGVPLRRTHSSRLAASVPRPKKYFAESESDWSISSDDDHHLIQMVKSLPAIVPYRPDEKRLFEKIRRNSMRALVYAASLSNLVGDKRLRSFEEGDGPNRSKRGGKIAENFFKCLEHPQISNLEIISQDKRSTKEENTDEQSVKQQEPNHTEAHCSQEKCLVVENTDVSASSRRESVESSTSCHILSSLPTQVQSTLTNLCRQLSTFVKKSQEPLAVECHNSSNSPVGNKSGDPDGAQIANSAYIQSVAGPSNTDLIKLRTEDGNEFWVLSVEAITKLNNLPSEEHAQISKSKEETCINLENREGNGGLKQISLSSNEDDPSNTSHRKEQEYSPNEEPSLPVFDGKLDHDENQNKIQKDVCNNIIDTQSSSSLELETTPKESKDVLCPNIHPESSGLLSASQPSYFLESDDFLKVAKVDKAIYCNHADAHTVPMSPKCSEYAEMKTKVTEMNNNSHLMKPKRSKKNKEQCLSCANVKASHITRNESFPNNVQNVLSVTEDFEQRVVSKEAKDSSVDPCILKKRNKKKKYFSSVDPPCFEAASSCYSNDKSCNSHSRKSSPHKRTFRNCGNQIGTDLDQAIRDHFNAGHVSDRNRTLPDLYDGEVRRLMKKKDLFSSAESALSVGVSNCKTRSPVKNVYRNVSKTSKSTQANDTLSVVPSSTLTSGEESASLTNSNSVFDKPSVVVVSLSSKSHNSPIKAIDNILEKNHQGVLLEWLKTVVPESFVASGTGKETESIDEKQVVRKKRGSSEPRTSRKNSSERTMRVAGRANRHQDNSSNALTMTDMSVDDLSLRSYLRHNSCQEDGHGEREVRHSSRKKCYSDESFDAKGSASYIISPTHKSREHTKSKNRSTKSESKKKEATSRKSRSTEKYLDRKQNSNHSSLENAKAKSRHSSSPKKQSPCTICGKADGGESSVRRARDQTASNAILSIGSPSTDTSSFVSAEELNLSQLRARFDRLVADLANVYKRDSDVQPQKSAPKPYDTLLELSMNDAFKKAGSMYTPATAAARESTTVFTRRKELAMPFSSDFLREFKFDSPQELLSREDDLMRQYSYSSPNRRFSMYTNLSAPFSSTRVSSELNAGLRNRRNSLTGSSMWSPSVEPARDLYRTGSAGMTRFASASAYIPNTDTTNNKQVFKNSPINNGFLRNKKRVFRENFGHSDFLNHIEAGSLSDEATNTSRDLVKINWNENANNGGQEGHDDDSSSSKSSTDEDFLEFEAEDGGSGAEISHSGTGMRSNSADMSSGTLPNVSCKNSRLTMGKEMLPEARSSYMAQAVSRGHFLGLLSGIGPDNQCMCPGCGCRSNNYQSSRKQDMFSRMPPVAIRNVNGSGNLPGKECFTAANVGSAYKGMDAEASNKDTSGGNNRASDEEFVSAIEHLSSTMRHCNNLMPRPMWQDCQEMEDTCNHWQDSSFCLGNGSLGRIAREDCLMHLDVEPDGSSKLYKGLHCGSENALADRGRLWEMGAGGSNGGASSQQDAGPQAQFCNVGAYPYRGQTAIPQRNGMTQWYQERADPPKNIDVIPHVSQHKSCNSGEKFLGKAQECAGTNCEYIQHEEIVDDDEEDDDDDDDDPADFEEVVEDEDEDEPDESDDDDEDDDADDAEEEAIENENHNKEVVRQRMSRDLDSLHAKKDFPEVGKQGGDMNPESKVATIANGRFKTNEAAGRPDRLGDYGTHDGKLELKCSSNSPRNNVRQKKFSLDQIKVPAIEKERVRFACDESGDWAEIGRGSYGCVYLGLLDGTIEVAIKDFYEASSWELVIHEARMLMFLQETGITPRLYGLRRRFDVSKQPSEYCIIMEYFGDGRTLFNVMSDKIPLRTDEWLDIVGQLVAGLRLIHRKGVLINDLKADNILVDLTKGRKVIRYIDVGMATYRQGLTFQLPEDQMNRYNFLAPE
ncbi:hypothetical protein EGW08_008489, partial [Elysia chlorotica]